MDVKQKTLVMKFGGTSVGTVEAMKQVVEIVRTTHTTWPRLVVVTSALSGITDLLISSAVRAVQGDLSVYRHTEKTLRQRHFEIVEALIEPSREARVKAELSELIAEFSNLCYAISVLGEASPRALDAVSSLGERLSVRVLEAAIESAGIFAEMVESTRLIITDDRFQNAAPDMEETTRKTLDVLDPILNLGKVPVVSGFLGATPKGIITTLGRGGSDFSASILGLVLGAEEVWIWTDVDGVMTADPRLVPNARTIPVLSYREVAEMAYYGAKVLHPKSIHPVIKAGISLRVCNTFNPNGPDSRLVADKDSNGHGTIKALAAIRGLKLVTVAGRGMLGVPGVAGRIFSTVATAGLSIPLIIQSPSEQSISFASPKDDVEEVLEVLKNHLSSDFDRGDIDRIWASEDVDVITLVCPGIRTTAGIAGKIFSVLGDAGINVLAICYGSSDVSINLVLKNSDTEKVARLLHELIP